MATQGPPKAPFIHVTQEEDDTESSEESDSAPRPSIPKITFGADSDRESESEGSGSGSGSEDDLATPSITISSATPTITISSSETATLPTIMEALDTHLPSQKRHKLGRPIFRRGGLCCGGCGESIVGRIVSAMGIRWHPACFQ